MQRFLILVGVAVVAAAMYVAASPASQQAKGPTAKQFNALKKQVASLSKSLKTVKAEATQADGFIAQCLTSNNGGALPTTQFGTSTNGYLFGTAAASAPRTALDIDGGGNPQGFLQTVDPASITSNAAMHAQMHSGSSRLPSRAEHAR
jgi:hypothetical protein